jgi:subtilisin family serine protease
MEMTREERYKITSDDYFDLLVRFNSNIRVFERYPGGTDHIMNDRLAVVYIPKAQITNRNIGQLGYSSIPTCYGLESERAVEASGLQRLWRNPNFDLRGQGVLVAIIDTGVDYTNPIFIKEDGTSKIAAIWDQTIESEQFPEPFFYGTEFNAEQINQALQTENPLELVPSTDDNGHGTMLAGLAVGSPVPENQFSGTAPEAELLVVKLKQMKQPLRDFYVISPDITAYQENDIMWAIHYVIEKARTLQKPVAICVAVGSSQGGHDGRDALGLLSSVLADFPGVVMIVSAGNEGNSRRHYYGEIDSTIGYTTVELNVGENEQGFVMEIWGAAPNTYSIDILSPTGEYIPRIAESLRVNREVTFIFEKTLITVDYQMVEASTGDQLILLRFQNPTQGIWRLQVYGRGDLPGSIHIWLPMNGFVSDNTYFIQPDPYTTITAPGNALVPITITAYNMDNNNLYQKVSRGYSRSNIVKPELAAPGVNMVSPNLEKGFTTVSGTGSAAAHTTGIAALLLEWGIVRGNYPGIDTVEVKKFLIRGARRSSNLSYPNRDWGYGMVDIYNVFDILRADTQRADLR